MAWINRLRGLLGSKNQECKVCIVGTALAGKSTLMVQLKPPDVPMVHLTPMIPMCNFKAEKFHSKAITFVAFDLGEQSGFGNPWEDFYRDCHAIIFVVDSTDRYNIVFVEEQLRKMLKNPLISGTGVPLLVLANKMDRREAVPGLQIATDLHLDRVSDRPWHIVETDALTGEGLNEGLDWLAHRLRQFYNKPYTIPM